MSFDKNYDRWSDIDERDRKGGSDDVYYQNNFRKLGTPVSGNYDDRRGVSRSELYLSSREGVPPIDNLKKASIDQLSSTRQEQIHDISSREYSSPRPNLGEAYAAKNQNLIKSASYNSVSAGITSQGSVDHLSPELYSPLFLTQNLQLPRDRITANAWNRAYYETNPIVRNAINLHATYPISKLNIKCADKQKEKFFLDMAERIDLGRVVQEVALEYWRLGEKIHKDSLVTMSDGSVKRIVDVQVGDYVITHLGNKKKVTRKWFKPTSTVLEEDLKIFKLHIRGLAEPLIISGKHPVFSASGNSVLCKTPSCTRKKCRVLPGKDGCGNCGKKGSLDIVPDFVEPISLEEGDLVFSAFDTSVIDDPNITNDFAYIIGQWLAEGCYCKAGRKNYTKYDGVKFCSYDKDYVESVLEPTLEKVFGFRPKTYQSKSTNFSIGANKYDTWLCGEKRSGPQIAEFFRENCGEYSKTKVLSERIMMLPPEKQLHILAGFLDGDGSVEGATGTIRLHSSSPSLVNQFMIMLRRAGLHPSVSKVKSKINGEFTGYCNYSIKLPINEGFSAFMGKARSAKCAMLKEASWCDPRTSTHECWQTTDITKIEDITDSFTDSFMYDIEVEDDHSYIANGIAIHNCFVYSSFDESTGTWDKVYLHNPDYISVKASAIPGVNTISLRPDPELQKIVTSNDPAYAKIRAQLDERVIHHVLQGEYIPLDNFNISHLKHLSAPYDIRGTSVIVSVWKDLMLYDKLRECHDVSTEILTENGFVPYTEVIEPADESKVKPGIKVACFNKETEELEYHEPSRAVLYHYNGNMIHLEGKKVDIMVTPNHQMLVSKKTKHGWSDWHDLPAGELSKGNYYKLRSKANWVGQYQETISYAGKTIQTDLLLEFIGYIASEGCLYSNAERSDRKVSISQLTSKPYCDDMRKCFAKVASVYDRKLTEKISIRGSGFSKDSPKEMWLASISDKNLVESLIADLGVDGASGSCNKKLPRWIFSLPPSQLNIVLSALVAGDGSVVPSKYETEDVAYRYNTISKQLADDVYELAYKCGYVPTIHSFQRDERDFIEYVVLWSETNYGDFPLVYGNENYGGANISEVDYNDNVWCLEVPTGYFVTRRNGKITIQHNCKFVQADSMVNPLTLIKIGSSNPDGHYPRGEELQAWRDVFEQAEYDRNFKIVTHPDVSVEPVGWSGAVLDTSADFQMITDNILMGLMVPKAIITQEGSTYASASVALDVMRQRYINFRNMMSNWLIKKIFAPIAEVQNFYKYEAGEKRLIVPEIEWNHMTLYDIDAYIGHMLNLYDKQPKAVSKKTLYRSLGLNVKDEEENIREESLNEAIIEKERSEMAKMSLSDLRSVDPGQPIVEVDSGGASLPGVPSPEEDMGLGLPPGLPPMPGGDMGGPLPMGGEEGIGNLGMPPPPTEPMPE